MKHLSHFKSIELVDKFTGQSFIKKLRVYVTIFVIVMLMLLVLMNGFSELNNMSWTTRILIIALLLDLFLGGDRYKPAACPIEVEFEDTMLRITSPNRFVPKQQPENTVFEVKYSDVAQVRFNEKKKQLNLSGVITKYSMATSENEALNTNLSATKKETLNQLAIVFSEVPPVDLVATIKQQV